MSQRFTSASLGDLLDPAFSITIDAVRHDRDAILAQGAALAASLPSGRLIRTPAGDPFSALVGLEAAWRAGSLPVPDAEAQVPTPLPESASHLDAAPADLALVLATSGSSGTPRLPTFRFESIALSASRIALYLGLSRDDTLAIKLPCDHGFGLIGQLLAAAVVGSQVVWCGGAFSEDRAARLLASPISVVSGVPHMLRELCAIFETAPPEKRLAIRSVGSAGAPLGRPLMTELVQLFESAIVWNQYGCTEAGPRLTAMPSYHPAFFAGTVGRAIPGVELWLDGPEGQPGAICFATDTAMVGYWGDPERTEAMRAGRGWRSGDIGVIDELDRLHVLGRVDDLVKVRGEKVSLRALAAGAERAGASAAHACAVPDTRSPGDVRIILAYEAPRPLERLAIVAEIQPLPLPRRMLWWPSLPRLSNGKIDRQTIDAILTAEESQ